MGHMVMVNIIKYKKKLGLKIFIKYVVKSENLGIECLGNSSHDECLGKKSKNSFRYSKFVLENKN